MGEVDDLPGNTGSFDTPGEYFFSVQQLVKDLLEAEENFPDDVGRTLRLDTSGFETLGHIADYGPSHEMEKKQIENLEKLEEIYGIKMLREDDPTGFGEDLRRQAEKAVEAYREMDEVLNPYEQSHVFTRIDGYRELVKQD